MNTQDKLAQALLIARDHIDMAALEVSHCKDASAIRQALAEHDTQQAAGAVLADDQLWALWLCRPCAADGEDDSMEARIVAFARAVIAALAQHGGAT